MQGEVIRFANEMGAMDRAIGTLALEAIASAEDERGTAALACLFVLVEQTIRRAAGAASDEKLSSVIDRIYSDGIISVRECAALHDARYMRNKMFHVDTHAYAFTLGEMLYPLNETGDLAVVFDNIAPDYFALCVKMLSSAQYI